MQALMKSSRHIGVKRKQFHPDLNQNDEAASAIRFRKIKEAYDTLNEPADRERYDRLWQDHRNVEDPLGFRDTATGNIQVSENDWNFACRYFDELAEISKKLKKFGDDVEIRWRNRVFFDKSFKEAADIAHAAEEAQLAKMVGASELLRMVARDALLVRHEGLLSELANALRVLGPEATELVIEKICDAVISEESEIDVYGAIPMRIEEYREKPINVFSDLTCTSDYLGRYSRLKYVFQARREIDAMLDNKVTSASDYQHSRSASTRTRRK